MKHVRATDPNEAIADVDRMTVDRGPSRAAEHRAVTLARQARARADKARSRADASLLRVGILVAQTHILLLVPPEEALSSQ
jgi:hypothetical protein